MLVTFWDDAYTMALVFSELLQANITTYGLKAIAALSRLGIALVDSRHSGGGGGDSDGLGGFCLCGRHGGGDRVIGGRGGDRKEGKRENRKS